MRYPHRPRLPCPRAMRGNRPYPSLPCSAASHIHPSPSGALLTPRYVTLLRMSGVLCCVHNSLRTQTRALAQFRIGRLVTSFRADICLYPLPSSCFAPDTNVGHRPAATPPWPRAHRLFACRHSPLRRLHAAAGAGAHAGRRRHGIRTARGGGGRGRTRRAWGEELMQLMVVEKVEIVVEVVIVSSLTPLCKARGRPRCRARMPFEDRASLECAYEAL